jgi:hypothetical protein
MPAPLSFLSSCKSDLSKPQKKIEDNDTRSFTETAKSYASTKFGIFYNSKGKANEGIKLHVQYERTTVVLAQFTGTYQVMQWLEDSGFQVLVNIDYSPMGQATAFVKDTILYKQKLTGFISSYKPAVAIIENEEDNNFITKGLQQII